MNQPISLFYLYNVIRLKYKQGDIVHIHHPNLLASLPILFLSKYVSIITHWHSDILNKGIFNFIGSLLSLALVIKSKYIICTSKTYALNSSILKYFKKKIKVIPIFLKEYKTKKNTVSINTKTCNIIFIGRLVKYKGVSFLINAMRYLPANFNLIIIGNGPEYRDLKNMIKKNKFSKKIKIYKKTSDNKKMYLLKRSDIFCLPSISKQEAFGVVLLEAMMLKKPVVTCKILGSGVEEVNKNNITGLSVEPKNSKLIAEAILKINRNYKYYSNNSYKRFKKLYSQKKIEPKIIKFFHNLK